MHSKKTIFAGAFTFPTGLSNSIVIYGFCPTLYISDEAAFAMNGKVNTRNVRQYAPAGNPPPFNFERNVSRAKVNVWAGMCGNGVLLGPFFIEGNLSGISYYNLLIERVFPSLMANFRDNSTTTTFSVFGGFKMGLQLIPY